MAGPADGSEVTEPHPALLFQRSAAKPYPEVVANALFAISEHNYRVTSRNHIGEAIGERTQTPFPASTIIHFCNLEHARELLLIAADLVVHMPCKIAIYEQRGKVTVATWLLPPDQRITTLRTRINALLRDVVEYAVR